MSMLDKWLRAAYKVEATDIHLQEGSLPYIRRQGEVEPLGEELVTTDDMTRLEEYIGLVGNHVMGQSCDEAFTFEGLRIRAHLYYSRGQLTATLRLLYHRHLALDEDRDSLILRRISARKDGLILITGPTGSGKSHTLASCLTYINSCHRRHIITLEDPIEFVLDSDQSLIHQRQLGKDMESMADGLRDALREDPDVIMIGELRDRSTLEAALHAAETGHLVFATLHTQRAVMAIGRMLALFEAERQEEVRIQLSQVLRAIICQRLLRLNGRYTYARDILLNTPAVANLIRQRKEAQITSIQETQPPMRTMEMAVRELEGTYGANTIYDTVFGDNQLM